MSERYLSWNPGRNRVWTEHPCFPKGAIKWRKDNQGGWYSYDKLRIYRFSEDRSTLTEIPESEWAEYDR